MSWIIAIDPGTTQSGVVQFVNGKVTASGVWANDDLRNLVAGGNPDTIAIEMIASYGMPVGAEVFETCLWIGRLIERSCDGGNGRVRLIYRRDVKQHLCHSVKAKDANVRQALIDKWGGKAAAIGTKKQPGPLYGVKSHAWAALAVAVTAHETQALAAVGAL